MIALKGAIAVAIYDVASAFDSTLNVYLNVFTLLLVVGAAYPIIKDRRKAAAIRDLEELLKVKTGLADERGEQIRHLEQASQFLKTDAAEWKARYEEQAKYTAEAAIGHFETLMSEHREQVAERHGHLLEQGERTAEVLAGVVQSLARIEANQT